MSNLSIQLNPLNEKQIAFLLERGFIQDKLEFILRILDKYLPDEIIDILCKQIESGELTIWESAEITGLSLEQMISELSKRNINIYDVNSLIEDLDTLKDL